jgi:translation initiation factor eIF-2B subunit epsilon
VFVCVSRKARWSDLAVKINIISSEDCQSFGDALRDLDAKGMIRNDFVLMTSGVITNTGLKPLLEEHKKTCKLDKGAVMTLVHRRIPRGHRSRSCNENSAIVADSSTGKIIAYAHQLQGKRLKIPVVSTFTIFFYFL